MALILAQPGIVVRPSDFYVKVNSIVDRNSIASDLSTTPFYFEFFDSTTHTKIQRGLEVTSSELYIVSFDGETRVNNIYEDGILKFIFGSYPFKASNLYYKQVESYANEDFDDGSEDIVTILPIDIEVKSSGCNVITLSSTLSGVVTILDSVAVECTEMDDNFNSII